MSWIMTKRGSQDNIITYEHYCDTFSDLSNIPSSQVTLGSTAVVINDEDNGLGIYMANSQKEWVPISTSIGGGSGEITLDLIHICSSEEYNSNTKVPTIEDAEVNKIYLVPNNSNGNNLFDEWIYADDAWEKIGGGNINIPVSDVQVNGTSIVDGEGVANIPEFPTSGTPGLIAYSASIAQTGLLRGENLAGHPYLQLFIAPDAIIRSGGSNYNMAVNIANQHKSVFYGLAKAAGDTTQSQSDNAVGTYTDEAKTAIQQMLNVPSTHDIPVESGTGVGSVKTKDFEINGTVYSNDASGPASFAQGSGTTASGLYSHAEGVSCKALGAATHAEGNYSLAKGTAAHAENFKSNVQSDYSHGEGYATIAYSGKSSHVEGWYTVANGIASHAEGGSSYSSKLYLTGADDAVVYSYICSDNVPEVGQIIKAGNDIRKITSVDIANGTLSVDITFGQTFNLMKCTLYLSGAFGNYSHTEGYQTSAKKAYSHAEGNYSVAEGIATHAEGYRTIANGMASHASGYCNVEDSYASWPEWVANTNYSVGDKVKVTTTADNETTVTGYICETDNSDAEFTVSKWTEDAHMNYVHIVGNGTADNARSNAYALDWDGNGHYAGDVYVGCNNDSTGGTKLPTDVQVNGVSVVSNGVANVPVAGSNLGVVKINTGLGIRLASPSNELAINYADSSNIKAGAAYYAPLTPRLQHESTFYGLAKAAGADMASSSNAVGTYTDTAKTAICSMIGAVSSNQGAVNAGKVLGIGNDGSVSPVSAGGSSTLYGLQDTNFVQQNLIPGDALTYSYAADGTMTWSNVPLMYSCSLAESDFGGSSTYTYLLITNRHHQDGSDLEFYIEQGSRVVVYNQDTTTPALFSIGFAILNNGEMDERGNMLYEVWFIDVTQGHSPLVVRRFRKTYIEDAQDYYYIEIT